MINSDGGSTDGTPDLIRSATFTEADRVQTSHPLRTLHRVLAPYHGLPGKHTALRTLFAAAELTQAKALVVIDPGGPTTTPERVTELIAPIARSDVEFLAPRYRRHPRDGVLITQLVRPLVRAVYSIGLDEPLGAEFGCSGRFASHCLEQDIWNHESARFAIDLWLRTEAVGRAVPGRPDLASAHHAGRQPHHAARRRTPGRVVGGREPARPRVVLAESQRDRGAANVGRRSGRDPGRVAVGLPGPGRRRPVATSSRSSRCSRTCSSPGSSSGSWTTCRARPRDWTMSCGCGRCTGSRPRSSTAARRSTIWPTCSRRCTCGAPRRSWRKRRPNRRPRVQGRLDALCETFQRLKPALVASWLDGR